MKRFVINTAIVGGIILGGVALYRWLKKREKKKADLMKEKEKNTKQVIDSNKRNVMTISAEEYDPEEIRIPAYIPEHEREWYYIEMGGLKPVTADSPRIEVVGYAGEVFYPEYSIILVYYFKQDNIIADIEDNGYDADDLFGIKISDKLRNHTGVVHIRDNEWKVIYEIEILDLSYVDHLLSYYPPDFKENNDIGVNFRPNGAFALLKEMGLKEFVIPIQPLYNRYEYICKKLEYRFINPEDINDRFGYEYEEIMYFIKDDLLIKENDEVPEPDVVLNDLVEDPVLVLGEDGFELTRSMKNHCSFYVRNGILKTDYKVSCYDLTYSEWYDIDNNDFVNGLEYSMPILCFDMHNNIIGTTNRREVEEKNIKYYG